MPVVTAVSAGSSTTSSAVSASVSTTASVAAPATVSTPSITAAEADPASSLVDEVCTDVEFNREVPAEFTVVHATAEFENSPMTDLVQDDLTSLQKFLFSEEHLLQNISRSEFEIVSKWKVNVKLYVRTSKLWEGARSYIWKHLGDQNFWSRGNGTKIRLKRIHVK